MPRKLFNVRIGELALALSAIAQAMPATAHAAGAFQSSQPPPVARTASPPMGRAAQDATTPASSPGGEPRAVRTSAAGPDNAESGRAGYAAEPCAPGHLAVTGYVKDRSGTPVGGAVVTLQDLDSNERRIVGTRASAPGVGQYCSGALTPAKYQVTVEKSGYVRQLEGAVDLRKAGRTAQLVDFVLYPEVRGARGSELWAVVLAVVLFLVTVWLARWYNVAWPNRGPLSARLESLKERISHEPDPQKGKERDGLLRVVEAEVAALEKWTFVDFLFWSRGQEQESWMRVHDMEQRLMEILPDSAIDRLKARLRVVEEELRAVATPAAIALANAAQATLASQSPVPAATLRAQVSEALQFVYDERDDRYWNLAVWQNKASWLLLAGAGMVIGVALVGGRTPLLVAGAAGGLLSRLIRAHRAQEAPTDYGASWATLFFSPVIGALTGWFGVLLVVALNTLDVLGSAFDGVTWDNVTQPMTLALALLMGISERFFDGLVAAVEQKAGVAKAAATPAPASAQGGSASQAPLRVDVTGTPTAVPEVKELKPDTVKPEQEVLASGYALAPDSVKKIFLIGENQAALEATGLKRGPAGELAFLVPKAAPPGVYRLKLIDALDKEHLQRPSVTVQGAKTA